MECKACTEKSDVIERVMETLHLPKKEDVVRVTASSRSEAKAGGSAHASSSASAGMGDDDDTPQDIKDILAKLKQSGGGKDGYKVRCAVRANSLAAGQSLALRA